MTSNINPAAIGAAGTAGTTVLITVTGHDKPGVTSVLFGALSTRQVSILDVEQVVIRGRLTLGVLVRCFGDSEELQEVIEQAMDSVGIDVTVEVGADNETRRLSTHAVVVLGSPVSAKGFSALAGELARQGGNIDSIRGIADYPVTGLELLISVDRDSVAADAALRKGLAGGRQQPRYRRGRRTRWPGPARQTTDRLRRRLDPHPGRGHRDAGRPCRT